MQVEPLISYLFTNIAVNHLPMFSTLAIAWRPYLGLILVFLNCCQVAEPSSYLSKRLQSPPARPRTSKIHDLNERGAFEKGPNQPPPRKRIQVCTSGKVFTWCKHNVCVVDYYTQVQGLTPQPQQLWLPGLLMVGVGHYPHLMLLSQYLSALSKDVPLLKLQKRIHPLYVASLYIYTHAHNKYKRPRLLASLLACLLRSCS